MRLISIGVQNFRSLKDVRLENCGAFNVFVGKNNAGKSNILAAIHMFFTILNAGEAVRALRRFGEKKDFCNNDISSEIRINAIFSLKSAEYNDLRASIIKEKPQVQTAMEALPVNCSLLVEMVIFQNPSRFGYVSKIYLKECGNKDHKGWPLLEIPESAAHELLQTLTTLQQAKVDKEIFGKLLGTCDRGEWERLKPSAPQLRTLPYGLRKHIQEANRPDLYARVQTILSDSASFEEFRSAVQDHLASLDELESQSKAAQLSHPLRSFSGEERRLPNYAKSLLESMAKIKILYLTERRKEIGADEAQKILTLKTRRGGEKTLKNIKDTVSELLGVKLDAFSAEEEAGEGRAELDVDDYLAEMNGSGIR